MQFYLPTFAPSEIAEMRRLLLRSNNELELEDFDELIALDSTRSRLRLWRSAGGDLAAFAFVDDFNNLCCAWDESIATPTLEADLVEWGLDCLRGLNAPAGETITLDASCSADNRPRLDFLLRHGFIQQAIRTLRYACDLTARLPALSLPAGFTLHCAQGEWQAAELAALHRAAFESDHMSLEYRLAIMRAPHYDPSLDMYLAAPDGAPAAFCIGSLAEQENAHDGSLIGYTDPVGVHPAYQGRGLGKAILLAGLHALQQRGVHTAHLGTSSENRAMQRLAEAVGFRLVAEKLWFARELD